MRDSSSGERWCAVSVDLDEIPHYHRIHGIPEPKGSDANVVYDVGVDRFLSLASELGIPLTFFVVGADTARRVNAARLRRAAAEGHELGSHSQDHRYDLVRLSVAEQRAQVLGALDAIESHTGVRPRGFRAPGYTLSPGLLRIIAEAGHTYDSSAFPCPAYYAAKAGAFGVQKLGGRRSSAILGNPRWLLAPTRPYRVHHAEVEARPFWELPIQVTRGLRLPYIGTSLVLAGSRGASWLTERVLGEPLINLELHGLDLLGRGDGLSGLAAHQPDARVEANRKRDVFLAEIERIRREGYVFATLERIVQRLSGYG